MPADERLQPLINAYIAAWTAIQTRQDRILTLPPSRRPAATRALERFTMESMDKLDEFTEQFLKAEFPGVYREGGQLAARRMGVPYKFDSSDKAAVQRLREDLFSDLLGKTNYVREDTKRAIRRMLKDELVMGRSTGKTVDPMRRDLVKRLKDKGIRGVRYSNGRFVRLDDYAQMALRTKAAIANNISGIQFGKRLEVNYWECLDGPLCGLNSHNSGPLANGLILPAEIALEYPISHPSCVMSGDFVAFGGLQEMVRAHFSGPAIVFSTLACPDGTTVGVNHPILTRRGWVKAGLLRESDEIIYDRRLQDLAYATTDADFIKRVSVEDAFRTVGLAGNSATATASALDFHGDAEFCQKEIDVVRPNRPLLRKGNPSSLQESSELLFSRANAGLHFKAALSRLGPMFDGLGCSADGIMSSGNPGFSLLGSHGSHLDPAGFTEVAYESIFAELVSDIDRAFNPQLLSDLGAGEFLNDIQLVQQFFGGDSVDVVPAGSRTVADRVNISAGNSMSGPSEFRPTSLAGKTGGQGSLEVVSAFQRAELLRQLSASRNSEIGVTPLACEWEWQSVYSSPITELRRIHFEGPVFDATTDLGVFAINGAIVSNCVRIWTPRPDIKTAEEAANGEPSVTEEQIEDQRRFNEERERDLRRRTAARRRREELLERRRRRVA